MRCAQVVHTVVELYSIPRHVDGLRTVEWVVVVNKQALRRAHRECVTAGGFEIRTALGTR